MDPIPGTELGKRALLALHESGSEFPVVFDDVAPRDFSEKVEPVVKSLYETPRGTLTPVAFSFNASQAYAPPEEVRRRAFLVHTQAVLDETRPEVVGRVRAERALRSNGFWLERVLTGRHRAPERLAHARTLTADLASLDRSGLEALARIYFVPERRLTVLVLPEGQG